MPPKRNNRNQTAASPRINTPLFFLIATLLLIFGGYYDHLFLLAGAVLAVLLALDMRKRRTLFLPLPVWPLLGLILCSLVTLPFAVSPGMAFIGVLRWLAALLFCLYAASYTLHERALVLDSLAILGAGMAGISVLFFLLSRGTDANGRLDGFFQYANSYALFLLICLVLLLGKEKQSVLDRPAMALLLLAMILTGSRGVLLLLGVVMLAWSGNQLLRHHRVLPAALSMAALLCLIVLGAILSDGLLLDRLSSITLESSSLNGRILYALDGLRLLAERPMGVGRGGYLYFQPLIQTGPYVLKNIHNEYLQAALDGGVAAGLLLVALVVICIFRRGLSFRQRAAAALLALHATIDFDFQFFALLLLLLLCGLGEETRSVPCSLPCASAGAGILAAAFVWFALPYTLAFLGWNGPAYALWPTDLSLAEERLQHCTDPEEAAEIADAILEQTNLSMLAWDCKFTQAAVEANYPAMAEYRYQYLRLNPYRSEVYQGMVDLLKNACAQAPEALPCYQSLAEKTETQLQEVMERTSSLAYRIADKPDFSFAPELIQQLEKIKEVRE